MRRWVLAAAFLLPACLSHAETLWAGNANVIAVTAACADTASVGDFFRAIYRPAGTGLGNGANSNLALFSQRSSFAMIVPNNVFRNMVNYTGQTISSSISLTSKAGGILSWQESTSFDTAPAVVNVTASLANFYGTTGCTGTIRVGFVRL